MYERDKMCGSDEEKDNLEHTKKSRAPNIGYEQMRQTTTERAKDK